MRYFNLDLQVERGPRAHGYVVRARSDHDLGLGEADATVALDPEDTVLQEALDRIASRRTDRRLLAALGDELYERLFCDDVRELLDECFGAVHALGQGGGVRVRLRIAPPEVAALPWELLHSRTRRFLATSLRSPLVRYLDLRMPIRLLTTQIPMRMLVAIPDEPGDSGSGSGLASGAEKAHLLQALTGLQRHVRPTFLDGAVTMQRVHDALRDEHFHCFHFIGHGEFAGERARLLLNDEAGGRYWADQHAVGLLFANHHSMKLVVLNSCEGATVSSSQPLVGMAPGLVKQGVPAVVAMQHRIADACAVEFAREFYHSLLHGPDRGRVDVAVSRARAVLARIAPDERDMSSPVLFMRAPDGVLFDAQSANRMRRLLSFVRSLWSRRESDLAGALVKTREANLAILEERQRTSDDPALLAALPEEKLELARLKQRIRFRNGIMTASAAALLLMFALSFVRLFDWLELDTNAESYTMALGAPFLHDAIRDEIVLITTGREVDPTWRGAHAELVEKLSRAGARVIAFDLFFEEPHMPLAQPAARTALELATARFAAAITAARARGTAVVLGARAIGPEGPRLDARLAPAFAAVNEPGRSGSFAGLGILCVGRKIGQARTAPLVVEKADQRRYPSLAFAAYAAYTGAEAFSPRWAERRLVLTGPAGVSVAEFGETTRVRDAAAGAACPAIGKDDRVADLLISLSPLEALRAPGRSAAYEDLLAQADEGALRERFEGRIVLVGLRAERDSLPVFGRWRQERYGLELHADAVGALLDGTVIRSAGDHVQLLLMAALALVGGFIRYWTAPARWTRRGLLLLAVLAYLASAIGAFVYGRVLLNTVYHVGALLLAYWLTGFVERRTYRQLRPRLATP